MNDLHLVCAHCFSVNRIPAQRLQDQPHCGKCKAKLFGDKPVNLSTHHFPGFISRNDVPVLVDFWAAWCGPCKAMAPAFAQAAQQIEPHVRFAKVDTDAEPSIAAQFAIRSIPTLILFKAGREIARQSGAMSSADLLRWLKQNQAY